ncbi:hypothetical protein [Paracoccus yeei]|uniref:Uncharacterized protein n=1 Tax=Paracoccus yeei TaxID=147645 RepID=A0A2D2C3V6_9RHOB|nr:hypothetical protein [Paracoccus yeei]ATQ57185.1 hypothetical protein PYTT13_16190 [Paracoccus yeei]
MARLGPEAHHTLPRDFAAALGQCVASFGWLEEVLKRTIYALDRARLADDLRPAEMQNWVERMGQLADDSMGTLIEQLDAAMRRHPGLRDRDQITEALGRAKLQRNLLCHASWRPTGDAGRWHPAFVGGRGEVQDAPLSLAELASIQAATLDLGGRVLAIMRATGIMGRWPGDDGP